MKDYRESLRNGKIIAVGRDGHDLILTVRDIYRSKYASWHSTITFSEVGDIASVYERNPQAEWQLKAGEKIDGLMYDEGIAWLYTVSEDWHDSNPVSHRIRCSDVRLDMRLSFLATFFRILRKF